MKNEEKPKTESYRPICHYCGHSKYVEPDQLKRSLICAVHGLEVESQVFEDQQFETGPGGGTARVGTLYTATAA